MKTMANIPVKDLRPGDLLLHYSKGEISKLIQWVSDSDYSHVAMVFEPGLLAEAISGGVGFDHSLAKRAADTINFHRIDAARPTRPDPLPAAALQRLQDSAKALKGSKFALNQMFELGLICAVKNKAPPDIATKKLVTWILETLVPQDPQRLVCSEFVYLAFHGAKVPELDPVITVQTRARRPFPKIDWVALWREYEHASGQHAPAIAADTTALSSVTVPDHIANAVTLRYQAAVTHTSNLLRPGLHSGAGDLHSPATNPEIVLPQDLAGSPTFRVLGPVVP